MKKRIRKHVSEKSPGESNKKNVRRNPRVAKERSKRKVSAMLLEEQYQDEDEATEARRKKQSTEENLFFGEDGILCRVLGKNITKKNPVQEDRLGHPHTLYEWVKLVSDLMEATITSCVKGDPRALGKALAKRWAKKYQLDDVDVLDASNLNIKEATVTLATKGCGEVQDVSMSILAHSMTRNQLTRTLLDAGYDNIRKEQVLYRKRRRLDQQNRAKQKGAKRNSNESSTTTTGNTLSTPMTDCWLPVVTTWMTYLANVKRHRVSQV
jgi:hypothetical protein